MEKKEIDQLIISLSTLHTKIIEKTSIINKETQTSQTLSLITQLPQKILIKVFIFLDFRSDIPSMLETCKIFNNTISSRSFQLILYKNTTKKPDSKKQKIQQEQETKETDKLVSLTKEEILERLIKTKKIMAVLNLGVQKTDEKLKEFLKNINKLNDDVIFK